MEELDRLDLCVNVDGLPLFKSSGISFWPVLCCVMNLIRWVVFPVALFCGKGKPDIVGLLEDFVEEAVSLGHQGIMYSGKMLKVVVRCVVCDAPARAMVKGVALFSGFYGCDQCVQRGQYERMKGENGGRVTFPKVDCAKRTDLSFRARSHPDHHRTVSPFCRMPIDMIKCFPVYSMHQVYEGVVRGRALLSVWLRGKRHVQRRSMSVTQAAEVSRKLSSFRGMIPRVFARKPRAISDFGVWKGTEFRQFLLYTSQLALKDMLSQPLYDHFMLLCVGVSILTSKVLCRRYHGYAHQILVTFVRRAKYLYGSWFLSYNVHSLTHLADAAANFGSLDECSAWKFENFLGKLKRMVRSGSKPLEQVLRRMHELGTVKPSAAKGQPCVCVKRPNNAYVLSDTASCEVLSGPTSVNKYECIVYGVAPLYLWPCTAAMLEHFKAESVGVRKLQRADQLVVNAMMIVDGRDRIFLSMLHDG